MIDELYLYSYANEPNKTPWRERLRALLPLRETATFPPQADHVLVVFFFTRGGTWGAALKPPDRIYGQLVSGIKYGILCLWNDNQHNGHVEFDNF